jgi:hypothetical protein
MANTAINHDPVATFPGSSTNTAVVKWSGTSGNALLDSGVIIDGSNNVTGLNNVTATGYLHLTGDEKELRFYEGANYIAIKTNASLAANYTLTLPLNDGSADEFLQTNGLGVLTWAAPAGTTINSNADNRVITGSGTANTLNGESSLTYDGTHVTVSSTNTPKVIIDSTSGNNGSDVTISEAASATGSLLIRYKQGAANGAANNMWYNLGFEANADVFSLRSGDTDGSANHGLVFSAAKGSPDLKLDIGNLVIGTAGKGIDFSATSNAGTSTPSELLDDYEEGTWTPTILDAPGGNSAGYTAQIGQYTKIGTQVILSFTVTLNSISGMTGGGTAVLAGFPFTPRATSNLTQAITCIAQGMSLAAGRAVVGQVVAGTIGANLHVFDVSAGTSELTVNEFSASGILRGSFSYPV